MLWLQILSQYHLWRASILNLKDLFFICLNEDEHKREAETSESIIVSSDTLTAHLKPQQPQTNRESEQPPLISDQDDTPNLSPDKTKAVKERSTTMSDNGSTSHKQTDQMATDRVIDDSETRVFED